ncbi:hypothetical protein [Enterovibrio baiacu]|uniref:hypothetical protein n=1 Tax=Enterovibrio baiacu TaxID=2491023 RepID=UPI001011FF03|nr:hypothetical protein [Enterovibrio baiacu]MBE1275085.1 hypothetical protein [Enterovibrio baiacu]
MKKERIELTLEEKRKIAKGMQEAIALTNEKTRRSRTHEEKLRITQGVKDIAASTEPPPLIRMSGE